jgi:hypothetical protein
VKAQYFQTVERIFLESTGRGLVISESDRYCIERWFSAGVPLDVVGRAVADSCSNRETPVRSLSLADRDVEKYFKAWKSRQVGADRTVVNSYAAAFDAWLIAFESHSDAGITGPASKQTAALLRTLRVETTDARLLQSGLKRAESFFYGSVWESLDQEVRSVLVDAVDDSFAKNGDALLDDRDELRLRMRNKKLRQRFKLPVFEIQLDGGWS